jgi:hypothetical protein
MPGPEFLSGPEFFAESYTGYSGVKPKIHNTAKQPGNENIAVKMHISGDRAPVSFNHLNSKVGIRFRTEPPYS